MVRESSRPIAGGRQAFDREAADGVGPSMVGDEPHQIAAQIAQKLRDAGVGCAMLNLVPTEPAVLRWDRIIVGLALVFLTALAWSYGLWLWTDMHLGGIDMSGFRIIPSGAGFMIPAHAPWGAMEFASVFSMWTVMMIGMMTPSAAPMVLMYARMVRHTDTEGTPFFPAIWFVIGYFFVWAAFSLLATLAQWALERTAFLDSTMASTNSVLGALVFVAAGSYQWTRLKDVCLAQCQTPFAFLIRQGGIRRDAPGCVMLGLRLGLYCVGCCWALMALLFVGGVTNVLWIALLALLVLLEKVASFGRLIAPFAGTALIAAGVWLLLMGMS
jgi:predicted metal-binding membrane protein